MAPFAKAHRARGLEVIGLQFEYTNDFARSVEQNRRFIARYKIDYPMLIAGTSGRDNVLTALPMLNTFLVYPTTVIVDRKGKVRKIHTGFPGPATGEKHRAYVRDFRKLIDQLLAERP
jgi:peroxiredoxin